MTAPAKRILPRSVRPEFEGDTWAAPWPGQPEDETRCPDCAHPVSAHHTEKRCLAMDLDRPDGSNLFCCCPRRRSRTDHSLELVPRSTRDATRIEQLTRDATHPDFPLGRTAQSLDFKGN